MALRDRRPDGMGYPVLRSRQAFRSLHFLRGYPDLRSERTEIFQAECLNSMLQHFGVIVVGHSYGGFVAFWMAHKYPNIVRGLDIVSSAICRRHRQTTLFSKNSVLIPKNVRDFKKVANFSFYKMPWLPSFIYKDLFQTVERNRAQKAELLHATVIGSKSLQALPSLNQDVVIVWGQKDRIFRLEEAYVLQKHLGEKAKVVVIKECGHVLPLEKPSELNQQILEFLQLDN